MANRAKKETGRRRTALLAALTAAVVLVCAAVIWKQAGFRQGSGTQPQTVPETTGGIQVQVLDRDPVVLDENLQITRFGSYSGIYMEDGSDEIVSGVMMIVLENTSEQDLQLARIEIVYPTFTAEFEVTTLPAGESVVALERSRREAIPEAHQQIRTRDVVFFQEPMSLCEDRIEISGSNGSLEVRNISREDIQGDFYIYYKNSAVDLLYGGITYRVRVEGGIPAGEAVRVIAGHYSQESSRLLMVTGIG